jgi:DNA-binding Xre family transcriptional regulator
MQRTGTGQSVSHRELADAVGIPHQTIGQLLSGAQQSVPMVVAHGICDRLGVGVLVLFAPPAHAAHITPLISAVSA